MLSIKATKIWYGVHKWSSLICTIFLLLLCFTGLPLIFHHEIDHWLGNAVESPKMAGDAPRASLDSPVAEAKMRRPGEFVQFVSQDDEEPAWLVSMGVSPVAIEAADIALVRDDLRDLLIYPCSESRHTPRCPSEFLDCDRFKRTRCGAQCGRPTLTYDCWPDSHRPYAWRACQLEPSSPVHASQTVYMD